MYCNDNWEQNAFSEEHAFRQLPLLFDAQYGQIFHQVKISISYSKDFVI